MLHTFDPLCLEAFERLLARPDPKDLPRRAHALRWEGEPNRRSTLLPPILMGWLQRRFLERRVPQLEREGEIPIAREAAALKQKALARIAELATT